MECYNCVKFHPAAENLTLSWVNMMDPPKISSSIVRLFSLRHGATASRANEPTHSQILHFFLLSSLPLRTYACFFLCHNSVLSLTLVNVNRRQSGNVCCYECDPIFFHFFLSQNLNNDKNVNRTHEQEQIVVYLSTFYASNCDRHKWRIDSVRWSWFLRRKNKLNPPIVVVFSLVTGDWDCVRASLHSMPID